MKFKNHLIVIYLIPTLGYSQKINFSIGVEAGVNTSHINGMKPFKIGDGFNETMTELSNSQGQIGGLFGQFHWNKYFAIQTGFYFEQKG